MAGGRCPTACVHPRTRGRASPHSIRRSRSLLTAAADADAGCRLRSSAPHKNEKTKKQRPIDADPSGCRPPALPHPQQRQGCREAYLLSAARRRCSTASSPAFSCRDARVLESEKLLRGPLRRRTCSAAAHPRAVRLVVGKARQGKAAREREEGPARLRRKDVHASESAGTREDLVILLSPLGGASNQRPRRAVGQIGVHVQNTELIYTCSVDRVCPKS